MCGSHQFFERSSWPCPTTAVKKDNIFGLVKARAKRMPILVEIGQLSRNSKCRRKTLSPASRSSEILQYAIGNNSGNKPVRTTPFARQTARPLARAMDNKHVSSCDNCVVNGRPKWATQCTFDVILHFLDIRRLP